MIGLNPTDTRELLEENLDIVMRLLRSDEPVSARTRTHELVDAQLHLRPYSDPLFDVAVAAVASPTGPRLAGQHGVGLLSIGATLSAEGFDALAHHYGVMQERAQHFGTTVDRSQWRLVGIMHVAETKEQAYKDVEHGIEAWYNYFQRCRVHADGVEGNTTQQMSARNEGGSGDRNPGRGRGPVQKLVDHPRLQRHANEAHDGRSGPSRLYELIAQNCPHSRATRRPPRCGPRAANGTTQAAKTRCHT